MLLDFDRVVHGLEWGQHDGFGILAVHVLAVSKVLLYVVLVGLKDVFREVLRHDLSWKLYRSRLSCWLLPGSRPLRLYLLHLRPLDLSLLRAIN